MAIIFYDTETTGTDTSFDQILQFAAIQVDADLNELDSFEIRCRISPFVVPSPGAMSVTGVTAAQLEDPNLPSPYEMMQAIEVKLIEWSPATFIGYNSIWFDEPLLRQAFYQSLLPVYLTNTNGNCRSDVMRMVQATSLYAPNILAVPLDDDGKEVFKLERVAPANGYQHDDAHDAMEDVKATIHMAQLIADKAPDVWSSFMRFSNKSAVIDYAKEELVFSLSDFFFGRPYSWHVTTIGENASNAAELYVFNLAIDPESFESLDKQKLVARLSRSPKPVRSLRSNASPMIMPPEDAPEIANPAPISFEELESRAELLQNNPELREALITAFELTKKEYEPSPHVEKKIYDGFFSDDEENLNAFREASWEERTAILEKFNDERLKELGYRLLHTERPHLLPEDICAQMDLALAHRLLDDDAEVPWLTLPKALQDLDDMLRVAASGKKAFLNEHREYLITRMDDLMTKLQ